jgi:hypothetical protein
MKTRTFLVCLLTLIACSGDDAASTSTSYSFSDNFDNYSSIVDLFPIDQSGWTNRQLVEPDGTTAISSNSSSYFSGSNRITLQSSQYLSIPNALRFDAPDSDTSVSKACVQLEGFTFGEGAEFWCSFDVYIDTDESIQNLFLADFESTEIEGGPGRRIQIRSDESVMLESKALYSGDNYPQEGSPVTLPKKAWVNIRLHLKLSSGSNGRSRVWQDNSLIIDTTGQNLPPDVQGYDRFQFGITANTSGTYQIVYIDNVQISSERIE